MFSSQIKAGKQGIKDCNWYRNHYAGQVCLEPARHDELSERIGYWANREECYREATVILEELQAEYRKRFFLLGFIPWPCRNGHDFKLGLRLSASARLASLEVRAGVIEAE